MHYVYTLLHTYTILIITTYIHNTHTYTIQYYIHDIIVTTYIHYIITTYIHNTVFVGLSMSEDEERFVNTTYTIERYNNNTFAITYR